MEGNISSSITLQPGNHTFTAEDGETILDAALKHGHKLPFSCREGACGMCKGNVLQGSVDHGKSLDFALSAAERAEDIVLFCCAKPKSDLVIERREMSISWDMLEWNTPTS